MNLRRLEKEANKQRKKNNKNYCEGKNLEKKLACQ